MGSLSIQDLNFVDIIFFALIFISVLIGFSRGFISEAISLITLIAAFVIAIAFTNPLASYFNGTSVVQGAVSSTSSAIGSSTATAASYTTIGISFAILFIATLIAGGIIKMILNTIFQYGILGLGNRLLGAIFGFARGYLFVLVIIFLVQLSSLAKQSWWEQSKTVPLYQSEVTWLASAVSPALSNIKSTFGSAVDQVTGAVQGVTNQMKK